MNRHKLRIAFPSNQIVLILMGILVLYLAVDFGRWVILSQQYKARLLEVQVKIESAKERQAVLQEQHDYLRSDAAPIDWARSLGWTKPDEVPVVIVAPRAAPGSVGSSDAGTSSPDGNLEEWWKLFFATR